MIAITWTLLFESYLMCVHIFFTCPLFFLISAVMAESSDVLPDPTFPVTPTKDP